MITYFKSRDYTGFKQGPSIVLPCGDTVDPVNGGLEYLSSHVFFTIGNERVQLDQQPQVATDDLKRLVGLLLIELSNRGISINNPELINCLNNTKL